jgi:hypothetical protein
MYGKMKANMAVGADVISSRRLIAALSHKGNFFGQVYRQGCLSSTIPGHNDITTEGKNHLLDVVFSGGTAVTTWYIGLIDNLSFSSLLAGDTLASHTGWSELIPGTDYTGNRQAWVEAAAASGSKASSSDSTFPILTTKTIYGILIASAATGTSGTLMATGAFDATIGVQNGDSFKVSYTISY